LQSALDTKHDGGILDNLSGFLGQGDFTDGSKIVGHLLGGNAQNTENAISQESGVSSSDVGSILSMLAPVVMGLAGKQKQEQGLDMSGIASLFGDAIQNNQTDSSTSVAMNLATKFLDKDGDGNIVDDLMDMGGSLLGGLFKK